MHRHLSKTVFIAGRTTSRNAFQQHLFNKSTTHIVRHTFHSSSSPSKLQYNDNDDDDNENNNNMSHNHNNNNITQKSVEALSYQKFLAQEQKKYENHLQFLLPHHVLPHRNNKHQHSNNSNNNNNNNSDKNYSNASSYGENVNRLVMRFDGCHFSAFTRPFHKPFDPFIHRALVSVAEDLLKNYPLTTVYVCSDEITAVFDGFVHQSNRIVASRNDHTSPTVVNDVDDRSFMGGRVQKMVSTCASFVSVRFKHHLSQLLANAGDSAYDRENHPVYHVKSMDQIKDFWHEKPYYDSSSHIVKSSGGGSGSATNGAVTMLKSHTIKKAGGHSMTTGNKNNNNSNNSGGNNGGGNFVKARMTQTTSQIRQHIDDHLGIFDARVVLLPTDFLVLKNIIWRSRHDCMRNSKTLLSRCYYTPKAMHGVSADHLVERLYKEHKVLWDDMPNAFKYGTFVKKETYQHTGVNPLSGEISTTERHRPRARSFLLHDCHSEEHVNTVMSSGFLFAKKWEDVHGDFWKFCVQAHE